MANRHHRKRRRQPCAARWRRLLVEQFEPRTLLATTPLFPAFDKPVVSGGFAFFAASDGVHGSELWKSDGRTATLVKDIAAGSAGSNPHDLADFHGTLYFHIWDGTKNALWQSDGTSAGTIAVGGDNNSIPTDHGNSDNLNGFSFYAGWDSLHGSELWSWNRVTGETALLKDINPGTASSNPNVYTYDGNLFIYLNNVVLFSANDGVHGVELWKSDGTASGTVLLKDTNPSGDGNPRGFQVINGRLFFEANRQLWATDGTAEGTVQLNGIGYEYPYNSAILNDRLYVGYGSKLWISDGTLAGTTVVKNIGADEITNVGGTLMFFAGDLNGPASFPSETALWKSDGTSAGTTMVSYVLTASDGWSWTGPIVGVNRNALFTLRKTFTTGRDPPPGTPELWRSDGTAAGTAQLPVSTVNHPPSGVDLTVTTLEDTLYVFQASAFPLTDPDDSVAPNILQAVKIASLPLSGSLTFNSQPVVVGQFIAVADLSQLKFLPAANANGLAYAKFAFQVQDDGGTVDGGIDLDPTPNTITIDVTPVNDPPFGSNSNLATMEDTSYWFRATDFGFSDPIDNQANQLVSVVVTSLPISGTLRVGGTPLTASNLATAGTIVAGNIGQLTFTPASNSNDSTQPLPRFAFRLRDNGGTANGGVDTSVTANTITISVTSVNDAPFSADRSVTTLEDTAYTFISADFTYSDFGDSPSNSFKSINIATLPQRGTLTNNGLPVAPADTISLLQIASGKLVFSPAANGNGVAYDAFTFRVQDDGGTANGGVDTSTFPNTLSFNVTPVNDPPSGSDRTLGVLWGTSRTFDLSDFGQSDANDTPQNDLQAVIVRSIPQVGTLFLNGSPISTEMLPVSVSAAAIVARKFLYQAPFSPPFASFDFQVQDSGGTANGGIDVDPSPNTLTLVIHDVKGLAPIGQSKTVTAVEDMPYAFQLSDFPFFDSEIDNLRAVKVATLPLDGTLLDNGSPVSSGQFISAYDIGLAKFTYVPPANANRNALTTFTFQVQDDGSTAIVLGIPGQVLDPTPRTLTINVTPVNDPPSGSDRTQRAIYDLPYVFSLSDFGYTDPNDAPPNDLKAVIVTSLPQLGSLQDQGIEITAASLPFVVPASHITAGSFTYLEPLRVSGLSFRFRLQDDGGTANGGNDSEIAEHTLSIFVGDGLNTPPVGTVNAVTTLEDSPYAFRLTDFPFIDQQGDNLRAVKIATLPVSGTLTVRGVQVSAGQFVSAYDIGLGWLQYLPAANTNGTAAASLKFQLQDDGSNAGTLNGVSNADLDPTSRTMTINVTPVNDPPSGTDNSATVRDCGAFIFSLSAFGFADQNDFPIPDAFIGIKITALPSSGTISVNGIGVTLNQFVSAADISNGRLKLTLPTGILGVLGDLKFQVQDSGGTANGGGDLDPTPNAFTFYSVLPPNTIGLYPINKTSTTNEDQPYVFRVEDFPLNDWYSDSLKSVMLAAISPTGARLKNNGIDVVVNQSIPFADIAAGRLTFLPPPNQAGIGVGSLSFRVLGDGGACTSFSATATDETVTFNAAAVNDPPSGSDVTVTTAEDTPYAFRAADFGFQDINDQPSNVLQAVKIATFPTKGFLTLNGQSVVPGQLIAAADIQASKLKFIPVANANGIGYANFTFQVQDDGGTANAGTDLDSTPNTLTIDVLPVNDAPSGTSHNLSLGCGSHTFTPSDFGYSDPNDSPANNLLSVRLTNTGAGTLTLNGAPYTNNTGVTLTQLNFGQLIYTPSGFAPTSIIFVVQDDGGTANGGTDLDPVAHVINISLTLGASTAPTGINSVVTTNEGIPYVFKITDFHFIDFENNNLKSITIGSPVALQGVLELFNGVSFVPVVANQKIDAIDITMSRLVFFPLPVNNSSLNFAQLLFRVQDDGGTCNGTNDTDTIFRVLTISVQSVNDPPEGADKNIRVLNGQPRSFAVADFTLKDPNDSPADNLLAVQVNSLPATGKLTNNGVAVSAGQSVPAADIAAGKFLFTPATDQPALASFEFQVQDDGGTANGGKDLDPTPNTIYLLSQPNHPPEGGDKTITLQEDSFGRELAIADFLLTDAGDAHADSLKSFRILSLPTVGRMTLYGQSVSIGQEVTPSDLTFGRLVFVPAANESGVEYAKFTYQIQDDGGTANGGVDLDPTPNTITFNVLSVNDPPSFNHLSGNYSATDENPQTHGPASQQCIRAWATDIIPGPADESDQTVSFIVTSTNPNLLEIQPKVNADGSLCYTPRPNIAGTATIGITLQDNLGGTSPQVSFQIQITKPHPLHNTLNRYDVSGSALSPELDGIISAGDALTGINYINAKGSDPIPPNTPPGPPYPDINADNSVAPDDVLEIINWLNAHPEQPEGPGNAVSLASDTSASNPADNASQPAIYADLLNMLAADAASAQVKRRRLAN